MKTYKSIAYAYPSSEIGGKTGGFFVKITRRYDDGMTDTLYMLPNGKPAASHDDPSLLDLYHGTDGEPSELAAKHHPEWQPSV